MAGPVEVRWTSAEELKKDLGFLDPAVMRMWLTLPGKGVPAGWQVSGLSKRALAEMLQSAYRSWPGEVCLTFEAPADDDESAGLSPRSAAGLRLASAAQAGDMGTVRSLLLSQVEPDMKVKENGSNTALNMACRGGHLDIAVFLLERLADPNSRNDMAETPLMCAANRARGDVCRLLLKWAADVHAVDENGDNALDFLGVGNSERKKDCGDVLRQAGCRTQR